MEMEIKLSVLRGMSAIEKFTGFERRSIIHYIKYEKFPAFLSKGGKTGAVYMANPKKIIEWWDKFSDRQNIGRQDIG